MICETVPSSPRPSSPDLTTRVRLTLQQSQNRTFRNVQVLEDNGIVILTGQLPSYYLKQLLQTVAAAVDGVRRLDNRVEVVR